jgi:ketosteroid isomerase-like protein
MTGHEGNPEELVLRLERELFAAWGRKDAATVDAFLCEDFVGTTADGTLTNRVEVLARLDSPVIQLETLELEDLAVRVVGDAAIVTGKVTVRGRAHEREFVRVERFTDVWARCSDGWQIVVTQNTRCPL